MAKRIAVLGSTGSIGRSALEVAASLRGEVEVVALAAGRNAELLAEQARIFKPRFVALENEKQAAGLAAALAPYGCEFAVGAAAVKAAAAYPDADLVISALVGFAGLAPTLAALEAGHDVALANKESLVAGGRLVEAALAQGGATIFPVDSEHAALSQCLEGRDPEDVKRLILTASGGPFWRRSREEIAAATPGEALAHPVWNMGAKISIDSATLMNKGLEVVEAHWLFHMPWDKIDVVIHPQSIIHSLVEMTDGSYIAQLAAADMRLPIQYALTWPRRRALNLAAKSLDVATMGSLEFAPLDLGRFPCFELAVAAGRAGGIRPAIMSAANEIAVERFLEAEIPFGAIPVVIEETLARVPAGSGDTYDEIARADGWARETAREAAARTRWSERSRP
jgi:1-deoxy-D-xylulose-5-phosphate reductoisomerase